VSGLGRLLAHRGTKHGPAAAGRGRWVASLAALVVALAVLGLLVGVSLRDPGAQ
jgi:hypothetical protein